MKTNLSVIKIGGALIEDEKTLDKFLLSFSKIEGLKILIHGGGKLATQTATQMGMETIMVDGRRITDADALKVITMVYGGWVNKTIVSKLQAFNCNALGLSGADGNSIVAKKRAKSTINYGFVGDVQKVNTHPILLLLNHGITPIFSAITHDQNGQLLNTNADTIATEVAVAMSELFNTKLYFCFEKQGVLLDINNENSVIETINTESYQELKNKHIIVEGMLPKLENSFEALKKNVSQVCIGNLKMITDANQKYTTVTL